MAQLLGTGLRHNASSLSLRQTLATHSALNTSLKIAGIVVLLSICALILLTQRASGGSGAKHAFSSASNAIVNTPANDQTVTNSGSSSSVSSQMSVSAQGGANNAPQSSMKVNVNGQDVPVPQNGSVQRTVTNPDGSSTSYSVNSSQGSSSNSSSTSLNVQVSTDGSSSASVKSSSNVTLGGDD